MDLSAPLPSSAPTNFVYCPQCATRLINRLIGDKQRRACPACGFIYFTDPKVGVGVLVSQNGRILLVKRAMMPEQGKWSIPAGYLDYGEDPRETALREVLEETNLRVQIEGLLDVYYNPEALAQRSASVFILFQARLLGGQLQAGDDALEAGFFGPDELPELAFSSTQDAIHLWQRQQNRHSGGGGHK